MTQGEIVVLSTLLNQNRYGYEIEKYIKRNRVREWTKIGFSSIYNTLNKLEKRGYISHKLEKEINGPKRKVYFILPEGNTAYTESLLEMLKKPQIPKDDIDVAIVYSNFLDDDQVTGCLRQHKKQLIDNIKKYKNTFKDTYKHKPTVALLFKRAIMHMESDIKWIESIINQ